MPSILKKLDGVINNVFSIGLKNNKTTILSTEGGLSVDNNIDVGDHKIKTTATPVDDNDVVTLSFVNQHNANCSRIYYQDFTTSSTITQDLHKLGNSCIIKNIVVDVLSAYNVNSSLKVSLGNTELVSNTAVNLNSVGQYHNSTFNVLSSTGDLKIEILNATIVGKIRLYIEYTNLS